MVIKASLAFYDVIMTIQKSASTFHKSQGIFSDIMATASRLNTLYRLETLYWHLSTLFRIIEKVVRRFRHLWSINDVINVRFLPNFAVFCYDNKCIEEFRNSWFSTRVCCDNLYCIKILTLCATNEFVFSLGVYVELTWYKLKQALTFCLIIYDH